MTEQGSIWRSVSNLFRSEATSPAASNNSGTAAEVEPAEGAGAVALAPVSEAKTLPWWKRRRARQAQTREVSLRLIELAGAMREHFRRQDQRAVELAGSLERVGGILEQLAEAQRSQGECLRTIAEHTDAASKHAVQLSETLGRVPDSLMTQAEAIRTVARQMELAQESHMQLMHSLQQFGQAVDTLGSSGTAQVEVLQQLNTAQREQHESMTVLVREQSRRFLLIMLFAGILALAGIAALSVTVVLQLRQ